MNHERGAWQRWHARARAGDVRILVIQRDNIGDLVLSTPFLRALHEALPRARIEVLCNSYNAPVLAGNTAISAYHVYTKLKHRPHGRSRLGVVWDTLMLRRRLRAQRFDLAIIMGARMSPHAYSLAQAIRAAQIAAFIAPGEPHPADVELVIDPSQGSRHAPVLQRRLLAALLPPGHALPEELPPCEIQVDPDARRALAHLATLASRGPVLAVHVSARKVDQRWSSESFAALMRLAQQEFGVQLMLLWAPGASDNPLHPGDDEKAEEIRALTSDIVVAAQPTATLQELIAALACADLVLLSDGGAMHLAAALRRPMVCMFGNSDPAQWAPWRTPYVLLRDASHKVESLTVAEVMQALRDLAQKQPGLFAARA